MIRALSCFLFAICCLACGASSMPGTVTGGASNAGGSGSSSGGGNGGSSGSTGSSSGGTTGASTSGGGDAGVVTGAACNPSAMPDTCFATGLACSPAGTCQYPPELSACLTTVGCAANLQCTPGYQSAATGAALSLCLYPCGTTADCPNPITNCQAHTGGASPNVCFVDFCGSGHPNAFYQSCNSATTGDGVCLPIGQGAQGEVGACDATGSLPAWSSCSGSRVDGGANAFCDPQSFCTPFVGATGPAAYICAPLCAPAGLPVSGPSCAAGQTCIPMPYGGYCLQDCGAAGDPPCPAGLTCGTTQGPQGVVSECLP